MKITKVLALTACVLTASLAVTQTSAETWKISNKEDLCEYLEDKKEAAEAVMKNGYSAAQYDKLEAKRKHWKKQYTDQCFDK